MRNLLDHSFLRWLRHGGGWENLNNYPNPDLWHWPSAPHSSITTLKLENVHIPTSFLLWMIQSCESLHTFEATSVDTPEVISSESRRWCVDILRSLQKHRVGLEHLRLDSNILFPIQADGFESWSHIGGFQCFPRLRTSDTTFGNLVGVPRGRAGPDGGYEFHDEWQGFKNLRDVVPETLERLKIRFDGVLEINCDEVFLGVLDSHYGNEYALKSVDVYYRYGNMFLNSTLTHPLDFWDVQMAFREHGETEFRYTKNFDLWGSSKSSCFCLVVVDI
jgi:hypothetical protein